MEKISSDFSKFIQRRIAPLKVTTNLLNDEMSLAKGQEEMILSRVLMESICATLEMFIEDVDELTGGTPSSVSTAARESAGGNQGEKRFEIPKPQGGRIG
ncbi:MAG: hypothetical protein RL885_23025 [Planctomycetota bacterium]